MGIFDFLRKRETEPEIEPAVDDVLLRAFLTGEPIDRQKAMTLPAVSSAVDYICNIVASMPVKLYRYKQGRVETVEGDARVQMLNGNTEDTLDAFQLKKAMVEDYLMDKGGYCYIRRSGNEVTGLFYVKPEDVTILKNADPIFKTYTINVNGRIYKNFEFIKIIRNTKDGASGVPLTVELSKALETAYDTLLYQLGLVKSGGNKKGFLKSQRKLGQEEINTLKEAWKRLYANSTENIVVLNNGLEFQEASNSSVEMQLNEAKNTLRDEINGIFHIGGDYYLTFKTAIYPIIKAFETALNRDLLLEREKKNYYFEFDTKEILRADAHEEAETLRIYKDMGALTINEIRSQLNRNSIDGMDVVNVGLSAVLYDTNTHEYYTPNTGEHTALGGEEISTENIPQELFDEIAEEKPNVDMSIGDKALAIEEVKDANQDQS